MKLFSVDSPAISSKLSDQTEVVSAAALVMIAGACVCLFVWSAVRAFAIATVVMVTATAAANTEVTAIGNA